ncbi:hypothetical protein PVK06_035377 [Gossypium arboreum]|uniref:Uncharacterized protein n=1 Tax=Gossypium arboreum TaxID=29729 RepID=A0ABR0NGN2_GOSAR|nr:hypothetical protein PVK06_035377 [Gossypium arboreum]
MAVFNTWNSKLYSRYVSPVENMVTLKICPSSLVDRSGHGGEVDPRSPLVGVSTLAKMEDDRPTVGEAFGPWMVVECKSRRKQNAIQGQKEKNSDGNLEGSRFEALASTTTESLRSDLEAPSKDLGMAKFIQGDFLKKLKGKDTEKNLNQWLELILMVEF